MAGSDGAYSPETELVDKFKSGSFFEIVLPIPLSTPKFVDVFFPLYTLATIFYFVSLGFSCIISEFPAKSSEVLLY